MRQFKQQEDCEVRFEDLTPEERADLIRIGYRPPPGTLLHNNIDLEFDNKPPIEANWRMP